MKRIEKALTLAGLGGLFVVAFAILGLRLTGTTTFAVMSGSMAPAIPLGSLLVVSAAQPSALTVGDVITYQLPDRVVTHRVVAIEESATGRLFTTKGDANAAVDGERIRLPESVGLVRSQLPFLGYLVVYAQAYWRFGGVVVAALVFLFACAQLVLGRGARETRPAPREAAMETPGAPVLPAPLPFAGLVVLPATEPLARPRRARVAARRETPRDEIWSAHLSWLGRRTQNGAAA